VQVCLAATGDAGGKSRRLREKQKRRRRPARMIAYGAHSDSAVAAGLVCSPHGRPPATDRRCSRWPRVVLGTEPTPE